MCDANPKTVFDVATALISQGDRKTHKRFFPFSKIRK
jgi:hypothetical protein